MSNYDKENRAAAPPGTEEIDGQIRALENGIVTLRVSGQLDDAILDELQGKLDSLKATITTIDFSPTALSDLSKQVEKALGSVSLPDGGGSSWADSIKQAVEEISSVENIGKRRASVRISDSFLF